MTEPVAARLRRSCSVLESVPGRVCGGDGRRGGVVPDDPEATAVVPGVVGALLELGDRISGVRGQLGPVLVAQPRRDLVLRRGQVLVGVGVTVQESVPQIRYGVVDDGQPAAGCGVGDVEDGA